MSAELFAVGISWRTAPVAVREKLAIPDDEVGALLAELARAPGVREVMLVSTCNRVEIYGACPSGESAQAAAAIRRLLPERRGVAAAAVADALFAHLRGEAVRHVFRVAAALDSLVVGESQILGQLKDAFATAQRAGVTGPVLGRCLERAFGVAKRVRAETGIARGSSNVASVAVELAARVFGELAGKRVLVVGAGKMSALAARHLRQAGVAELVVTNRSPERAARLAAELDAVARPWEALEDLLVAADVVISSTGARTPILTAPLFKKVAKRRRWRPIVVVDIAVPRDADPAIGKQDGVYVFDIDDLERVVAANLAERQKAADAGERIVAVEVGQFDGWLRAQKVVPTIRALREHFARIADAEVDKLVAQLARKELTAAEREEAVRRSVQLVVARLLHQPQMALKADDAAGLAAAVQRLFALELVAEPAPGASGELPAAEPVADPRAAAALISLEDERAARRR
ncbi:MAG: glutamyl-tRNA reductase [Kofleriaceae bacterium]|nr:glutamyl-tRNA reductase [Kofleriaceae bacterium]MCL4225446.1 glutamyl-tRNA reductase [Myxococcales bacterium]